MTDQDFELKMKRMIANLQFAQGERANEKGGFKNKKASESQLCYECGNPGHYANRCPNKNSKNSKSRTPSNAPNNRQRAEWRNHAPKAGEPTSRIDRGVTYHWCAKCNRWTKSHNTENHVSKAPPGSARNGSRSSYNKGRTNSNSDTAIAANMVLDPGAWVAMATTVSPKRVQRRNTSEDDKPTEAAPEADTPVIEDEEQRAVDRVPAIVARRRLY